MMFHNTEKNKNCHFSSFFQNFIHRKQGKK